MTERDLFLAARPLSAADRRAYLEKACGDNGMLRAEVEALLREHDELGSFLESPAPELAETIVESAIAEQPGTMIGRYRLLEPLGEGGFGIVFRAEQQRPVRRLVALKILKPGMDTRQIIGRFEAERQALALMDHPHIARVLDGGETASGRPFFVMELVHGVPLTDYCDQQRLPPRERLELFIPVCQAVQHAHQKGIIHRDLKPSNVLVTADSGVPVAKVIDFGIAKALGQRLTEITVSTGIAQLVGTPLYMSPEQAELRSLDIDTRSDIYSLGVLLYELLTGTTPFDKERLQRVGYDEMRRIICEEEPPTPSTRVSGLGQAATVVAAQRQSELKRLSQLCRGELDWIVMKALEKDRNRRYETASALAADVQHYLYDEPVLAGPPSAWYRLSKFARRNRTVLAVAAGLLVMVAMSAGSLGWALRDRSLRREQAVQEATKAREDIDQLRKQGQWTAALAVAQRAEALLAGEAPDLHQQFSRLCRDLKLAARLEDVRLHKSNVKDGDFDAAGADQEYTEVFRQFGIEIEHVELRTWAEFVRTSAVPDELAAALDDWAQIRRTGHKPGADSLASLARAADPDPYRNQLRDALEKNERKRLEELAASEAVFTLPSSTIVLLARALADLKAESSAITLLRQAQIRHPDDFWINTNLGLRLDEMHPPRSAEAARFFMSAMGLRPQSPGAVYNVGYALKTEGQLQESVAALRRAIELKPEYVDAYIILAEALEEQGNLAEAEEQLRRAIQLQPHFAFAHNNLGNNLVKQKRLDEAVQEYRRAIQLNPSLHEGYYNLGRALTRQRDYPGAIEAYRRAIKLRPDSADAICNLGVALRRNGQLVEAMTEYRRALALQPSHMQSQANLAYDLSEQGNWAEAVKEQRRLVSLMPSSAEYHSNLGLFLSMIGKAAEAEVEYREAIRLKPELPNPHFNLGNLRAEQNRIAEAIAEYFRAVQLAPAYAEPQFALAVSYVRLGRWDEAAAQLKRHLALAPNSYQGWYLDATLQLRTHDIEAYRRACAEMIRRFRKTNDPQVAHLAARICVLSPSIGGDMESVLDLANRAILGKSPTACDPWAQWTKALAEYRAGHYFASRERLMQLAPKAGAESVDAAAFALLAMIDHRQDHPENARAALDSAQAILKKHMPQPQRGHPFGEDFDNWLDGEILYREALELVKADNRRAGAVKPPVVAPGH
jgi:serine/threonine protein kinase/Flp pilus assembly protein TadD